jgi:hypothetical protein
MDPKARNLARRHWPRRSSKEFLYAVSRAGLCGAHPAAAGLAKLAAASLSEGGR